MKYGKLMVLGSLTLILSACGEQRAVTPVAQIDLQNATSATDLLSRLNSKGISASYEEYRERQVLGGATEADFIQIVNNNVTKYPSTQITAQIVYGDIATQIKDLNPQEKTLCNQSASQCAAVLAAGGVAHFFSSQFAGWQSVTTDNERDAIRHGTWNACMTMNVGYAQAQAWANAHEYGSATRIPSSIGEQMDFYNNSVGRNIGNETLAINFPAAYRDEGAARNVKAAVKSGRLRVVSRAYASQPQASGNTLVASNVYSSAWPSSF
ncbi:hypothetical protein [Deinococcus sp.]|uniref:DUF6973 domain-containing protein n=1 Tax=Deinococcus sp. TaxID=47478 RepID=UPI0025E6DA52|nr:hypothetical protein [Deinococcus sp.]